MQINNYNVHFLPHVLFLLIKVNSVHSDSPNPLSKWCSSFYCPESNIININTHFISTPH